MVTVESLEKLEDVLSATPVKEWKTRQAIVFDWFDGPREGVCSFSKPQGSFYFELLDERTSSEDADARLFILSQIPDDAVERIVAALKVLGTPTTPVWVPIWTFPDQVTEEIAENAVAQIIGDKIETDLVVYTRDMVDFFGCWRISRNAQTQDWFEYLGID